MARGPRAKTNIGYVSDSFNNRLRVTLAELEAEQRRAQKKRDKVTGQILFALQAGKTIKDFRDDYLADKFKSSTLDIGQKERIPVFEKVKTKREGIVGKTLGAVKDEFLPKLKISQEVIDFSKNEKFTKDKYDELKSFGVTEKQFKDAGIAMPSDKINKDAALMATNVFKKQLGSNLAKSLQKKQNGGKLVGPSHAKGGILTQVGDQPIEMEGGEYVIRKSSVKKLEKSNPGFLAKLNKTGKIPKAKNGGPIDTFGTLYGAYGDIENIKAGDDASAFSLASTGLGLAGKQNLSQVTGGLGNVYSSLDTLSQDDVDPITQTRAGAGLVSGIGTATKGIGSMVGSKVAQKIGEKTVGTIATKVTPGLNIASGVSDIASSDTTGTQKVGGAMTALGGVAATNFWNPAGWVAGALLAGGTLLNVLGQKQPTTASYKAPTVRTGRL